LDTTVTRSWDLTRCTVDPVLVLTLQPLVTAMQRVAILMWPLDSQCVIVTRDTEVTDATCVMITILEILKFQVENAESVIVLETGRSQIVETVMLVLENVSSVSTILRASTVSTACLDTMVMLSRVSVINVTVIFWELTRTILIVTA